MEEILSPPAEAQGNPAEFSIITIFLDIEDLEALPILDEPDIICLLGGLAGAVDRVDAQVFIVLSLLGVDHYHHVHVVLEAYLPQLGHQGVLQLELLEALTLLG